MDVINKDIYDKYNTRKVENNYTCGSLKNMYD